MAGTATILLSLHEKSGQGPRRPAAAGARRSAARYRPAPDLQRDVRRRPPDRCGLRDGLPARTARNPGSGRLDGRNDAKLPSWPSGAMPPADSTSSTCTALTARATRRARWKPGLRVAKANYIAIFDADFIPPQDFLLKTLPHFTDPTIGMVQARWGHINADYSLLTKIQAILLDAHFVLEHGGRNRAGLFLQLQRHRRRVAARSDRLGGWMAARHADRGSRPQLSRAAPRLEIHVPARTSSPRPKSRSR